MKSGLRAETWNALIANLIKWRILGVTEIKSGGWRHPWTVSPYFDPVIARWVAQIEPGFIGGLSASISLPFEDAPAATQARLQSANRNPKSEIPCFLTERPALKLDSMRNIGPDATPAGVESADGSLQFTSEPVPAFFKALGVGDAPKFEDNGQGFDQVNSGVQGDNSEVMLLRACDLVVFKNRPASETQWTTGEGVDGSFAQFDIVTKQPSGDTRPFIRLFEKYTPPTSPDLLTKLSGNWGDITNDAYFLATVYLVSPKGAVPQSIPDQTWTAYVAHNLFWNLNYALNRTGNDFAPLSLQFPTGLAAGAADLFIQSILAQVNDADNAAAQFLNNNLLQALAWSV